MKLFLFLIGSFVVNFSLASQQNIKLDLNDVSILLPLPQSDELDLLPQPETTTHFGQLLPKHFVVKYLPMLLQFVDNSDLYPTLRAIGIRVDPCFTEGHGPVKCKQQVRIVWQPLKIESNKTTTVDVTLHSFYELTDLQFKNLINNLKNIKETEITPEELAVTNHLPLQTNPLLIKKGLKSDYYKKILAAFYKNVGEETLSRITFMSLFANETVWFFGGINIDSKSKDVTKIIIPRINNGIQQFINDSAPSNAPETFFGRIFPAPKDSDNFNDLISDSSKFNITTEDKIIAFTRAAFKFENPNLNNPGTLDCVSCHAAQPVRSWALRNFKNTDWGNLTEVAYTPIRQNNEDLSNLSPLQNQTNILRAFGYFKEFGFVSQRVINETNEVVNTLEMNYLYDKIQHEK